LKRDTFDMTLPHSSPTPSRSRWIAVFSGACLLAGGLYGPAPALAQDQARVSAGRPMDLLRGGKPAISAAQARARAVQRAEAAANRRVTRQPKAVANGVQPVPVPQEQSATLVEPVAKATVPAPAPGPVAAAPEPRAAAIEPVAVKPARPSLAQDYCANVSNAASEFRFAWQMQQLTELEAQINKRIAELNARRAELAQWQEKHDEYRRRAEEGVVAIYSRMRPDAASSQLAVMEEAGAAAILSKLSPKTASLLLNEMNATKAAKLADLMTTGSIDASRK